jgi:hypothetical protein
MDNSDKAADSPSLKETLNSLFTWLPIALMCLVGRGVVIKLLWGWFVVTQFTINSLSIAGALGLSMLIGVLTHYRPVSRKEREESREKYKENPDAVYKFYDMEIYNGMMQMLTLCSMAIVGWVIHLFM